MTEATRPLIPWAEFQTCRERWDNTMAHTGAPRVVTLTEVADFMGIAAAVERTVKRHPEAVYVREYRGAHENGAPGTFRCLGPKDVNGPDIPLLSESGEPMAAQFSWDCPPLWE